MAEQPKEDAQNKQDVANRFQDVKNGPVTSQNRECRDILCCILMLGNLAAMIALAIYAYTYGDTSNIYRATDQNGNICGQKNTITADYPYAYFYNPTTMDLSKRVCTKNCPIFDSSGVLTALQCKENSFIASCNYQNTVKQDGSYDHPPSNTEVIGYESSEQIGRVCVPSLTVVKNAFSTVSTSMSDGLRQAGLANFITDLQNNWRWLILSMVLAVLLSFIFMFILRCFAGCFVWLSIILLVLVSAAAGILFCYNGGAISRDSYIGNLGITIPTLPNASYYNIFGYICFGFTGLLIILTLCCCSRIRLAVAVCNVAGQFIARVCQVIFVPIIMGAIIFGLWVVCILAMIGLIGGASFVQNGSDVFTSIQSYTDNYLAMFYYFVFGTLWVNALLQAIAIFVIASACAMWYYSHGPEVTLDSPISGGFWMAFRYHFGSLSFGSLILAIVQFIQFIVQLFNKQAQANGATQNQCVACAVNCLRCFIQCLKRIIQFLNRNAYIQIAITGKSFCSASADAFNIITSNPLRYTIVQGVGQILMFIGKLLIAGLTTFLFYLLITLVTSIKANVQQPIYLLILVFIAAFAIAVVFMAVYSVAMQTLLACFIIDQTTNKKAQFSPPELVQLMDQ